MTRPYQRPGITDYPEDRPTTGWGALAWIVGAAIVGLVILGMVTWTLVGLESMQPGPPR